MTTTTHDTVRTAPAAPPPSRTSGPSTAGLVRAAVPAAFRRLDPRHLVRQPVIFVVWVGSVLSTCWPPWTRRCSASRWWSGSG